MLIEAVAASDFVKLPRFVPPPFQQAFPGVRGVVARFYMGRRYGETLYGVNPELDFSPGNPNYLSNKELIADSLGVSTRQLILSSHQKNEVAIINVNSHIGGRPTANAMVMKAGGNKVLSLSTNGVGAPVFFADVNARVIGAAYISWPQAEGSLIPSLINGMCMLDERYVSPQTIVACVGPCSGVRDTYEVEPNFLDKWRDESREEAGLFLSDAPSSKGDRKLFAQQDYIVHRVEAHLRRGAVSRIELDTIADERFYSARQEKNDDPESYARRNQRHGARLMFSGIKFGECRS